MKTRSKKTDVIDDYHRLEIEEIFIQLREYGNRSTQYYSFMGTAHLITLGLAYTNQKVSILILALIFPIAMIIIDRVLRKSRAVAEFRGLELENLYAQDPEFALLHLLIGASQSSSRNISKLRTIHKTKGSDSLIVALRMIRPGLTSTIALLMVLALEIALVIVLSISGWSMF